MVYWAGHPRKMCSDQFRHDKQSGPYLCCLTLVPFQHFEGVKQFYEVECYCTVVKLLYGFIEQSNFKKLVLNLQTVPELVCY